MIRYCFLKSGSSFHPVLFRSFLSTLSQALPFIPVGFRLAALIIESALGDQEGRKQDQTSISRMRRLAGRTCVLSPPFTPKQPSKLHSMKTNHNTATKDHCGNSIWMEHALMANSLEPGGLRLVGVSFANAGHAHQNPPGAKGIATRSKDATRGSWPYY